ncbi:hypothetical protein MKK67_00530 [Methylobacterium sp. J-072]|uniref:hypothetical protein n=1 Tax=Methylobacterium sp. J-072 TaxID=2836651 RepID=UPI001FBB114A|nr:hypothetical protein [Methylobacterium sp. J-072]MCJ2091001.1 hypothetical protein [Methylobacterium sp. J-072]
MSRLVRPDFNTSSLFTLRPGPVNVLTNTPAASGTPGAPTTNQQENVAVDNYTTRIVKYIPTEVISFNLAADKSVQALQSSTGDSIFVTASKSAPGLLTGAVFLVCLFGLPFYYKAAADRGQPIGINVTISMAAFILWSYATDGSMWNSFGLKLFDPSIASLSILIFTFIVGFVVPGK